VLLFEDRCFLRILKPLIVALMRVMVFLLPVTRPPDSRVVENVGGVGLWLIIRLSDEVT
jgi:hypothetical protein